MKKIKYIFTVLLDFLVMLIFPATRPIASTGYLKLRDVAFTYRMGAGFAGDVSRQHPSDIEPNAIDNSAPMTAYGQAAILDSTSGLIRPFTAADDAVTTLYGVTVRPFPTQQAQSAADFGAVDIGSGTPPTSGVIDILRAGYITVKVVGTTKKGDPVFIWTDVSDVTHTEGGFESAATATKTAAISNAQFNNAPDADGNVEIRVWPAQTT